MRFCKSLGALALALLAATAWSGPVERYIAQRFDQLAAAGQPMIVAVHATWCPTCKAQEPILERLMARPEYRGVTELTVDFDADKATLKRYHVATQSTLIAFKGGTEVGRSIGDTTPAGIEGLVRKAAN